MEYIRIPRENRDPTGYIRIVRENIGITGNTSGLKKQVLYRVDVLLRY